jgi:hypothetical protein
MPSSFAGVCASTVTWLLSGGSLAFHHPFDGETLLGQIARDRSELLVAPAPLALRLHLATCAACTRFSKQLAVLGKAMACLPQRTNRARSSFFESSARRAST